MNQQVRFGIIGMGLMGTNHAKALLSGRVPRATLAALCDVAAPNVAERYPGIPFFPTVEELLESQSVDAVIVATPHRYHVEVGCKVLERGVHLLVEKPVAVHKNEALRLVRAQPEGVKFCVMFNLRVLPPYRKIRELIESGELGRLHRVSWSLSRYFRTHAYYAQGGWRGTWKGEGGGVLLNQCPHQLDLWQWLFGMPDRVYAKCRLGKHHPIHVEDEVTAMLDYRNGLSGVFIASTGEAPGTDRLEIHAERGRLVYEHGELEYLRNEQEATEYSRTSTALFGRLPHWSVRIPCEPMPAPHAAVVTNFVDAILDEVPLVAPGHEGVASLELGNAILLSSLKEKEVALPLDGCEYEQELAKLVLREEAMA